MFRDAYRIPLSTCRLQFHRGFTFRDARGVIDYLDRLGVTDCYSSPYMKASPGSAHGYDICDHTQFNPEIGTEADFDAFTAELASHHMGQVLDVVPNHMGIDPVLNPWWHDVLENGHGSPFAGFFDIDWHPVKSELIDRVLLPILGDQYGLVLERGELHLALSDGAFVLRYFDHELPVDPQSAPIILRHRLEALQAAIPETESDLREYLSVITALEHLPAHTERNPECIAERQREKEIARGRLQRLLRDSERVRRHVEDTVRALNGEPGQPRSFDCLHALLDAQVYRLANWRTASHEINYRRFFDINTLAGLRMERPEVFSASHSLVLRLIAAGTVTGLRIDHIDGLFDPPAYLLRLQEAAANGGIAGQRSLWVVVEKILSGNETLPEQWAVDGTSGYDFLNDVNGLFVDARHHRALRRIYQRFTGQRVPFADVVYESKRLIMSTSMSSELNVLAHALNDISEQDRCTRDFTLNSLRQTLREVVASFPVYRTYISAQGSTGTDRQHIMNAIRHARRRNPTLESSIFDFLRDVLLADPAAARCDAERDRRLDFAMKFQQYTGPVQAKGLEDTAFYRYNVLLSLNEVGGDPQCFGRSPAEFHRANLQRQQQWPTTMLASASHDTKRGEDVRARINVLSEIPEEWGRVLSKWARLNARHRSLLDGAPAPDRNDEYLLYQTLVGIWPPEGPASDKPLSAGDPLISRVTAYMLKAVREAKVHTSWLTMNQGYEEALTRFVERVLSSPGADRFLSAFLPFQARIAQLGMVNSLAQLVLKLASPGVPDFYQGTELWDLSLVDPDNRRLVDYEHRRSLLHAMEALLPQDPTRANVDRSALVRDLLEHWQDGRIKLFITACGLRLRRVMADLFLRGSYRPLDTQGVHAGHAIAFAREHNGRGVIAVVPRLVGGLRSTDQSLPVGEDCWEDTSIRLPREFAAREHRNVFTGEVSTCSNDSLNLPVAGILRSAPIALLYCG